MSFSPRLPRLWIIVPFAVFGYLLFLTSARLQRVDDVTNLVPLEAAPDPASPTGYAGGVRRLIVPEHDNESYQWIIQTQQMLRPGGPWRIRHVLYDNAPVGRSVLTPSPYRWWLGLVATIDHAMSGRPIGASVEQAARLADPILQILLLAGATVLVAWRFGAAPASFLSVALGFLFPLGGNFLAGQPGDGGLELICMLASLLLLLAGVWPRGAGGKIDTRAQASRWFVAAGVAGGFALWIDAVRYMPVLAGVVLSGLAVVAHGRRCARDGAAQPVWPWRVWGLSGAITTLAAYLLEYAPDHLGTLNLREVHPLYGLAWLGAAEVLAQLSRSRPPTAFWRDWRGLAAILAGVLAVATVPAVAIFTKARDLFTIDPNSTRLARLAGSPIASDFWTWIRHDGIDLTVAATVLPLLFLAGWAGTLLASRRTEPRIRTLLLMALGPTVVMLGFAWFQLRSWNSLDTVMLALLVALVAAGGKSLRSRLEKATAGAVALLLLTPGAIVFTHRAIADRHDPATGAEVQALLERDLAQWLARQAGPHGAVVLAPPNLTMSLIYHGGLSGIGTPFWENKAGFLAAMRLAGASSADEGQAVARGRDLGYIVAPSWDNFLEEYARLGAVDPSHTVVALLQRWLPPRWLRPVPYHVPKVAGFENESVAVFQVVDVQDNATALSCLAEYFVEMEMPAQALGVANALERSFPADLGAAVARTLVARASGDASAFRQAFDSVEAALKRGDDESLTWDRRVSLAIALAEGRRFEEARAQVKRCLEEIDETQLRSLTTLSLRRLLVMCRTFGLQIDDPKLRSLASQLLPPELRETP